jgi:hypothetical protein
LPGEFPNGVQVSQIDVPGKRVSRVFAIELSQTFHYLVRRVEDSLTTLVRGADGETFSSADANDFLLRNRSDSGDLYSLEANGANFSTGFSKRRGCLAEIAKGVELDGDLIEFHSFFPVSVRGGRRSLDLEFPLSATRGHFADHLAELLFGERVEEHDRDGQKEQCSRN